MIERRMLTMSLKWVIPLMVAVAFSLQLPAQQSGLYVPSQRRGGELLREGPRLT